MMTKEVRIVVRSKFKSSGKHDIRVVAYAPDGTKKVIVDVRNAANDAGSSAESEYKAVLSALEYLGGLVDKMGHKMPCKTIIYTASKFVADQLNERADARAENIVELRNLGWMLMGKTGAAVERADAKNIQASLAVVI